MTSLLPYEGLVVEAYRDLKKAVRISSHKLVRFNENRKLVRLIELMRATEQANTKTIAFQTDGLSAPLWMKLIGNGDCDQDRVLSWAKTERLLKVRDAKICAEVQAPIGTLSEARGLVLCSVDDAKGDIQCTISRAFGWEVLDVELDNPKSQALRQRLGEEFQGTCAGDLSLCDLFSVSGDDVDISDSELPGREIPIGFAIGGKDKTVILLLSDRGVVLFHNNKKFKKYLNAPQQRSIASLVDKKKPLAESLAEFVHRAAAAFRNEIDSADAYLTAVRFAQKFLSLSTANMPQPVDGDDMSRKAAMALRRDAARLHHIAKTSYNRPGMEEYIDLSSDELKEVHRGQASLSKNQNSRVFHDLSWQDEVYKKASADKIEVAAALVGTLSDDEKRTDMVRLLYSEHKRCIRDKKDMEAKGRNSLKLNLAVMCYNRLTKNEYATVGFENVLRKSQTTMVLSDKYKAIYTPHSQAAVLYFDEKIFSDLRLPQYQPIKGVPKSVLGLVAVLHDQLKPDSKAIVDDEVYKMLQEGLHNITVVQDKILETIRSKICSGNEFRLKVSNLYLSIAQQTADFKVRKWLEREVLGFLASYGVPNDNSTTGFSSMFNAFSDYYKKTASGLEVTVDRAGNLTDVPIRVCQTSGSYVMCQEDVGLVLMIRKEGTDIKKLEDLQGRLHLVCRPGNQPIEEYIDLTLGNQEMFG